MIAIIIFSIIYLFCYYYCLASFIKQNEELIGYASVWIVMLAAFLLLPFWWLCLIFVVFKV